MGDSNGSCFGLFEFFPFVGDGVAEDVFVDLHRLSELAGGCEELGEQSVHVQCGGVKRSPYATQVVAHVFAEMDGGGVVAACELDIDETVTEGDDGGRWP